MRIQQVDSILKESHLARKANEQHAHGHGSVVEKVTDAMKSRKAKLAAGTIAGVALATAGVIFFQQHRKLKNFWEV